MKRTVNKRALDVGMTIDVSKLKVSAPWSDSLKGTRQKSLFIVRLERKYGNNVHGERILQHTIVWDNKGAYVMFYHHFEENIRLVNPKGA
jgi:hypothetical protein